MRTAAYEPSKTKIVHEESTKNENEQKIEALKRYEKVLQNIGEELMVSGSDDFKLILWNPAKGKIFIEPTKNYLVIFAIFLKKKF